MIHKKHLFTKKNKRRTNNTSSQQWYSGDAGDETTQPSKPQNIKPVW